EASPRRPQLAESKDLATIVEVAGAIEGRDPDGAVELYRVAAEARNVAATARRRDLLAGRDAEESSKWRTQLAESKDLTTIVEVAGAIEGRDPDGAVELYRVAAEAGRI